MMKAFLKKYSHVRFVLIYFVIYLIVFFVLEHLEETDLIITSTWIDQYIPFCEYFVIPYLSWFAFIFAGFVYFCFFDISGFNRTCFYLFVGMTTCLIIYIIVPNAQDLRVTLPNDNIFQMLVSFIYSVDSPTNVCPSIHVYNTVMMAVSLFKSEGVRQKRFLRTGIVILSILICLSTVFLKQHAFLDIVFALILCVIMYVIGKYKYGY